MNEPYLAADVNFYLFF